MEQFISQIPDYSKFFIAVLSVLNPIGVIPTFITMTKDYSRQEVVQISKVTSLCVFITLAVSILFGNSILNFFGVSIASFRVGGGILIGSMAFKMLHGRQNKGLKLSESEQILITKDDIKEIAVVPLAIPLLSGPGSISTVIIYGQHMSYFADYVGNFLALILITLITFVCLLLSRFIASKVGKIGMNITTRIMGLILMALAVESIFKGVKSLWLS